MKDYLMDEDQLRAKKLLSAAHKKMYFKDYYMIKTPVYGNGTLTFIKYEPMCVFFVEYGLEPKKLPQEMQSYQLFDGNERWYVTQGTYKDCVFYLNLINSTTIEFNLEKHICGLKHKYI